MPRDIGQHFWIVCVSKYCGKARVGCHTNILHWNFFCIYCSQFYLSILLDAWDEEKVSCNCRLWPKNQDWLIPFYRKLKASHSSTLHTPINFTFQAKRQNPSWFHLWAKGFVFLTVLTVLLISFFSSVSCSIPHSTQISNPIHPTHSLRCYIWRRHYLLYCLPHIDFPKQSSF